MVLIKKTAIHIALFVVAFLLHNFLYYFGDREFFPTVICAIVAIISAKAAWLPCECCFFSKESIPMGIAYGYLFIVMPIILAIRGFVIGF